uniref:Ig-like domain-containing protein n=1 Tax=Poecilia latipinna TaxID=48699 RepID=A0A3B3U5Z1_9TELE
MRSTVDLKCNYTHPDTVGDTVIEVRKLIWYTKGDNYAPVDLKDDQDYAGRIKYKHGCTVAIRDVRESDSAVYKFRFITNHQNGKYTGSPGVTLSVSDMPNLPSVSMSSSGHIVEGDPINLTCSSDANPAATYTWYKKDTSGPISKGSQLVFKSVQSSDSGKYFCAAENVLKRMTSGSILIDVEYAPNLPRISLSASEIMEGISLTLSCSSDSNPAANYTWFKEKEKMPQSSGQNLTITNIGRQHSGLYFCEAHNSRGSHKSAIHLTVAASKSAKALISVIYADGPFLFTFYGWKQQAHKYSEQQRKKSHSVLPVSLALRIFWHHFLTLKL